MPTRRTESTHERDFDRPLAANDPHGSVESPSADQMQGANGLPHDLIRAEEEALDPESHEASGDQDIDTAGTDADETSPTKSVGTGIAPDRSRG
jgi:hypothetical protein